MSDLDELMSMEALDLGKKESIAKLITYYRKLRGTPMKVVKKKAEDAGPKAAQILELVGIAKPNPVPSGFKRRV